MPDAWNAGNAPKTTPQAALDLGLVEYDRERVHGHRIASAAIDELLARLAALPVAERRELLGLEPERAPTLYRARKAGKPVDVEVSGIAADSLGARRIGEIAWDVTQASVDGRHLLSDAAIRSAGRAPRAPTPCKRSISR